MSLIPRRLFAQLFLLVAAILLATFVSFSWLTSARQTALLEEAMEQSASVIARNLSESCAHFLVVEDYAGLENFVLRSADLPTIVRIQVCETNGAVLADVVHAKGSRPVIRFDSPLLVVPQNDRARVIRDGGSIVVWHPIAAGPLLGWIKATFTLDDIAAMRAAVWKNTVALGALWLVGGLLLLLAVLRPPLTAIRRLSQFARRLNELKGERIAVHRGSLEIEQLEDSLNFASRELSSAERQLVAERERLAVTLQSIGDGVIATDTGGGIVLMNKVAERLTGWGAAEAAGRHLEEVFRVVSEADRKPVESPVALVLERKTTVQLAERTALISRDGTERSIADSGAPIVSADNDLLGVVLVFRDVTEKKKMKAEQQKLEDQLRQAQKMEAVGQLAGGIAHDFNNILSAIIGYGSLLQMRIKADDRLRAAVDPILEAAHRASSLTHSLLAFSRKQIVELKPTDINAVVTGVENILKRLIREDVEFVVALSPGQLTAIADKGQVEQVLMNLVTNARDAMPRGGRLMISTEAQVCAGGPAGLAPGSYAVISVSDTGTGMDKETSERIFEPFFTTKETGKGSGLGLSMVYGIMQQHHGAVHVYSEPGIGTTFKLYFPLAEESAGVPLPVDTVPPRGSGTILLVEDDRSVREIARIMLEEFGYTVLTAADGDEALALFRSRPDAIDLVLTDVIMPNRDGSSLIEEVRRVRPDMKALFMSGYTADIITRKKLLEPGTQYLAKPLSPQVLLSKIKELLGT